MTGNGSSQTGSRTGSEGKPPLMMVKLLGGEDGRFRLPFGSEITVASIAALESTCCFLEVFFFGEKETVGIFIWQTAKVTSYLISHCPRCAVRSNKAGCRVRNVSGLSHNFAQRTSRACVVGRNVIWRSSWTSPRSRWRSARSNLKAGARKRRATAHESGPKVFGLAEKV